ncbi:MAG TPA: hypothetical protein VG842_07605 [Sediminibacterium sp.]|nr:hypothetical protein [Sediminibacterium sp.]
MTFDPINWLEQFLTKVLLPQIGDFLKQLTVLYRKVGSHRAAWNDILFVSRALWFYLSLNLLAIVFFWVLPQGTDILYAMIEDFYTWKPAGVFFLFAGTLAWSMLAEFAARYRVMVIDNSGNYLTQDRVLWRKFVQKAFVKLFLLFPFLIMTIGVFLAAVFWTPDVYKAFSSSSWVILILISGFLLVYNLYFGKMNQVLARLLKRNSQYRQSDEYRMKTFLFGIYNDYIFRYHNGYIRGGDQSIPYGKFYIDPEWQNLPLEQLPEELVRFPYSADVPAFMRPHPMAELRRISFPAFGADVPIETKDAYIRWEYKINAALYPVLNREVRTVAGIGFLVLLIVSILPISAYQFMGSASLVAFAFAGWIGITTFLLYLDKATPFKGRFSGLNAIPWRFSLLLWLLFCSWVNSDHPVRTICDTRSNIYNRVSLQQHFATWVKRQEAGYLQGMDRTHRINDDSVKVPLLLVCAEGGALRTGAMAGLLLAKLQDKYPTFKNHIYAFSTVSGGSVGVGLFNAITYRCVLPPGAPRMDSLAKLFFKKDFLAPVIARMFYGDIFHLFSIMHFDVFDRAVALEQGWEQGFHDIPLGANNPEVFNLPFLDKPDTLAAFPAWFINTTEVETGNQSWITNVIPDSMALSSSRDVLGRIPGSVRYSTAINFSTRFPLMSPGAALPATSLDNYHFVDGGYVENTGAQTMLEMLVTLRETDPGFFRRIIPYVLMIRFGPDDSFERPQTIRFGNEWSEIINGLYNTRRGRAALACYHLLRFCRSVRYNNAVLPRDSMLLTASDVEVNFNVNQKKVPMNWLLSDNSLAEVNRYCQVMADSSSMSGLMKALGVR